MGLYEVPLFVSLLGEECESKRPMCFRCPIFMLSELCMLLFLLCFIASWACEVVSVMLYPCMFCVALSMDLFVLCVACLRIVWGNNSQYVWVCLLFCC